MSAVKFTYNIVTENDFWSNIESEESLKKKMFFFSKNLKRTEDSKDTGKGPILGMGKRGYTKGVLFFNKRGIP